jgi:UPF0271 protein
MMETVRSCKKHGVKIGAHPGLPDLQGFGRREMKLSTDELTAITVYQVGALKGFLDREGVALHHVKPHGSLYGMCCRDYDIAKAVFQGIPKGVKVFGLPGTCMEQAARDLGIEFVAELYADVKYNADASLVIERKKQYGFHFFRSFSLLWSNIVSFLQGLGPCRGPTTCNPADGDMHCLCNRWIDS